MLSPRLEQVGCEWLLRSGLRYAIKGRRREVLWSVVADIAGVGSRSAIQICTELGWDPHQQAGQLLPKWEIHS